METACRSFGSSEHAAEEGFRSKERRRWMNIKGKPDEVVELNPLEVLRR